MTMDDPRTTVYHLPQNIQCLSVCHNAKILIPYLVSMIFKKGLFFKSD